MSDDKLQNIVLVTDYTHNLSMKRDLKAKLEEASKTPDEPLFLIGDVKGMAGVASPRSITDFDYLGIINIHKDPRGFRRYSYNDIQFILALRKLIENGMSMIAIKFIVEFERRQNKDLAKYVQNLSTFVSKYKYKIKPAALKRIRKQEHGSASQSL